MKQANPREIKPFASYTTEEVAKLLDVNPQAIRENKEALGAKKIGKGYRFLGENLLTFMGSPTISQMQPNYSSPSNFGAVTYPLQQPEVKSDRGVPGGGS